MKNFSNGKFVIIKSEWSSKKVSNEDLKKLENDICNSF